jgi:hypothetical protein
MQRETEAVFIRCQTGQTLILTYELYDVCRLVGRVRVWRLPPVLVIGKDVLQRRQRECPADQRH